MTLRYAYDTAGTALHRRDDALSPIIEAGCDGVAPALELGHATVTGESECVA